MDEQGEPAEPDARDRGLGLAPSNGGEAWDQEALIRLVTDCLPADHSRRAYRTGLLRFFAWVEARGDRPAFGKALVMAYRASLLKAALAPATVNLRLSPVRRLAREMADNGRLDPTTAAAVERVPGIAQRGTRAGNWLTRADANALLNAPSPTTLKGRRDRAILALLLGCGLRRAELVALQVEDLQQRDGRWVLPDLPGKGGRLRTIPVPAGVKTRVDAWLAAAYIHAGPMFRPLNRGGRVGPDGIADEKMIWLLVLHYAGITDLGRLAPHDLRRTCAKLCRASGGALEQIQLLLGHSSIQTTERYLGTRQDLQNAVNDRLGLELDDG